MSEASDKAKATNKAKVLNAVTQFPGVHAEQLQKHLRPYLRELEKEGKIKYDEKLGWLPK